MMKSMDRINSKIPLGLCKCVGCDKTDAHGNYFIVDDTGGSYTCASCWNQYKNEALSSNDPMSFLIWAKMLHKKQSSYRSQDSTSIKSISEYNCFCGKCGSPAYQGLRKTECSNCDK